MLRLRAIQLLANRDLRCDALTIYAERDTTVQPRAAWELGAYGLNVLSHGGGKIQRVHTYAPSTRLAS